MEKRVRLMISLPADLLRRIDRRCKRGAGRNRIVEEMLVEAVQHRERLELDEEVRAYYARPPTREEEEFSRPLSRIARRLAIDEPPRRRR